MVDIQEDSTLAEMIELKATVEQIFFGAKDSIINDPGIPNLEQLLSQSVLVKRLSAVENLVRVNNICSEKSGVMTQNRLMITDIWVNR